MLKTIRSIVPLSGLLLVAALSVPSAEAQLAAPNASGVSVGHIHFRVSDAAAHREFWQSLGAREVTGGIPMLAVAGTYLLFAEGEPSGPSNGSSMNHVGFLTRSYEQTKASLEAFDATITVDNTETGQILATLPDGVGVELQACDTATVFDECPTLQGDIQFHHFHASSGDNAAIRQWYLDAFGMDEGERRGSPSAVVPGGRVDFMGGRGGRGGGAATLAPTQGRAIDHIGLEVTDMTATVARLERMGVTMDRAPQSVRDGSLTIAFLTDPDGTYIELTQGLGQ